MHERIYTERTCVALRVIFGFYRCIVRFLVRISTLRNKLNKLRKTFLLLAFRLNIEINIIYGRKREWEGYQVIKCAAYPSAYIALFRSAETMAHLGIWEQKVSSLIYCFSSLTFCEKFWFNIKRLHSRSIKIPVR